VFSIICCFPNRYYIDVPYYHYKICIKRVEWELRAMALLATNISSSPLKICIRRYVCLAGEGARAALCLFLRCQYELGNLKLGKVKTRESPQFVTPQKKGAGHYPVRLSWVGSTTEEKNKDDWICSRQ
jgi:hypothetical protein